MGAGVARSRSGYRSWCCSQAARSDGSASAQESRSASAWSVGAAGVITRALLVGGIDLLDWGSVGAVDGDAIGLV